MAIRTTGTASRAEIAIPANTALAVSSSMSTITQSVSKVTTATLRSMIRSPCLPPARAGGLEHLSGGTRTGSGRRKAIRRSILATKWQHPSAPCRRHKLLYSRALTENHLMRRRIAIVEDDPAIRANYADALAKHGYEVTAHSSRPEALAALRGRLPDLVLL